MLRGLILAGAAAITFAAAAAETPSLEGAEHGVLDAANDFRSAAGLRRLRPNQTLASEARAFAAYLARTDRFSHTADGRDPGERARAAGYAYCDLAENIAIEEGSGFGTEGLTRLLMSGWEGSPGHRRNLLDPDVTETGVGVARVGDFHRYFAVQVFGRPASERFQFSIDNRSDGPVAYDFGGEHRQLPARTTVIHTSCERGGLAFDGPGGGGYRYAVEPGAAYVVSRAPGGVQIEIRHRAVSSGQPVEDRGDHP